FDYWVLDGSPAGSANPINILMGSDHTLRAVFKSAPQPPPVGGYSISLAKPANTASTTIYVMLVALFAAVLSFRKRKRK
ncbi:MAG: hypothetical protein QXH37_05455, partial [Candidatus Bathyarchaeia archaeon]